MNALIETQNKLIQLQKENIEDLNSTIELQQKIIELYKKQILNYERL